LCRGLRFEPAFQDHRRRRGIDVRRRDTPAAQATGARCAQPFLGILRGPAFIYQVDG